MGERLAYLALHRDYGFERIACESPEAVEAFKTDGLGSEICVRLSNCANGLDRWMEIEGLEVCGSEHVWKPVRYAYYESDSRGGYLRIRSEDVFDPTEVRYGWGDFKPAQRRRSPRRTFHNRSQQQSITIKQLKHYYAKSESGQ